MSTFEARSIFTKLGCNAVDVQLATQHAFYKPITSDPEMLSTQALVRSMQRGLQRLGAPVKTTGRLDPQTTYYLEELAGPEWKSTPWLVMGKSMIRKHKLGQTLGTKEKPPVSVNGLGEATFGGQAFGLLLIAGVAFIAFKTKK